MPTQNPGPDATYAPMARNLIRERRKALGLTQAQLAAEVGMDTMSVSRIERGQQALSVERLNAFAKALKTRPTDLLPKDDDLRGEVVPAPDSKLVGTASLPKDVPVLGTVVGGSEGDFALNGEVVDLVRRPPGIAQNRRVFALYVAGDSMSPWQEPGALIYCSDLRAARAGDYVVVEAKPKSDGDPPRAFLKRLVSWTPSRVILEQFNPQKRIELPGREVIRVVRVLSLDELMGF